MNERQSTQATFEETRENNFLKCPYCGYEEETTDLGFLEEHPQTVECSRCERPFNASVRSEYTWIGAPING